MRKRPAKFLSVFCASVMALNAAALSAFAEDAPAETAPMEGDAVSADILEKAEDSVLYWETSIGIENGVCDWNVSPTGFAVADNGFIYICSGDNILKLDKFTGDIVLTKKMAGAAMYASKGPAYADGKIFMALDGGMIQAFDAETLESLWIYKNKNGGSPKCDIVYKDGKIYTGFWTSEESDADFVRIDVKDEDEETTSEEKLADWEATNYGGYYWTTPYFTDDYVYVGREDGNDPSTTDGESIGGLYQLDIKTGEPQLIDYHDLMDDICSKLVEYNGKFAFTSRNGVFHIFDPATDTLSSFKFAEALGLEGATCTSTPIIIGNRAYVTVNGAGWGDYNGSAIVVLNLTEYDTNCDIHLAYSVDTKAACQVEGIYAGTDAEGYDVIYYTENGYDGTVRVLRDKPGMKEPITVEETDFNGDKHAVAPKLFAPPLHNDYIDSWGYNVSPYCAVDPVYDAESGFMFVRYDDFRICAIGPAIKSVEFDADSITTHPGGVKTLVYMADSTPTSAEDATITLSGGCLGGDKDVFETTDFSVDKFTKDDEVLTVTYNYGIATGTGKKPSVSADVAVLVAETKDQYTRALAKKGDVNGDGKINSVDIVKEAAHIKGLKKIDKYSFNAADVNGDGKINAGDIASTAGHVKGLKTIKTER